MKLKHVFITLGLAVVLGMGVGTGLKMGHVKEAKAAGTKTFYLLQNSDWSDWANPRIHYWGGDSPTSWDSRPSMTKIKNTYTASGVTGTVYSYEVPTNSTGLLITKGTDNTQTNNYDFATTWGAETNNAAYFYYESANKLQPFVLTLIDDGAYLRGDWADGWDAAGQKAMTTVTENSKYSVNGVDLSANGAVKMVVMTAGVENWAQFNSVSSTDSVRYPVKTVDDGFGGSNAAVVSTGTYNITVTKNGGKWDYQFEGTANEDLNAAVNFATSFTSAMNENCPYTGTNKTAADVVNTWSSKIAAYSELSGTVKTYLTNGSTTVTQISDFHSSYDYIYGNYAGVRALAGADFLGRTPPVSSNIVLNPINENNNVVVIFSCIGGISLLVLVGFLFLKKRKESK